MQTLAVVLQAPKQLELSRLSLLAPGDEDVVVDIAWSGISTGTERLLWSGTMPPFPGMGYPLVPGYESVGRVFSSGPKSGRTVGDLVFVAGSKGFDGVRGLFGGAASRVVVPGQRAVPIDDSMAETGVLLALAATAYHAIAGQGAQLPDLIIGHGVLGRLIARMTVALGGTAPTVWETSELRRAGAVGYSTMDPGDDARRDYRSICDVSGDSGLLDTLVGRLAPRGEVVLAGFYSERLSFSFPPAFMREARLRIAAEWQSADLIATRDLIVSGRLLLDGLITHRAVAQDADQAYRTAFGDPACLKMILDWRNCT